MKLSESTHPLALWLVKTGRGIHGWAAEALIPAPSLYAMLNGRKPGLELMAKIEDQTCGEVSVRQIVDWHISNGEKKDD